MSDRLAFAPLSSLETALDRSVQQRARALFETAKAKTARGSGHELDRNIAGNGVAVASACLLLAKTELEGESTEDWNVHQRYAMITKPQFRVLLSSLQSVLELRSTAKNAFTPIRGSARKRKAEAQEAAEEPSTPSRSSRPSSAVQAVLSSAEKPATPTRSVGRRSTRTTASLRELATASHQKTRRNVDEDLTTDTKQRTPIRSSARRLTTVASVDPSVHDSPSKTSAKGKQKATEAFEKAINQRTPTKTKLASQVTPSKAPIDYSKPFEVVKDDANGKPESEEIPYETYWGDMLVRFRRKEDKEARRGKMEAWRENMLLKLKNAS